MYLPRIFYQDMFLTKIIQNEWSIHHINLYQKAQFWVVEKIKTNIMKHSWKKLVKNTSFFESQPSLGFKR